MNKRKALLMGSDFALAQGDSQSSQTYKNIA